MALTKEALNARMAARNPKLAATAVPTVQWDIPEHKAEIAEFEQRMNHANKFANMETEVMIELARAIEGI